MPDTRSGGAGKRSASPTHSRVTRRNERKKQRGDQGSSSSQQQRPSYSEIDGTIKRKWFSTTRNNVLAGTPSKQINGKTYYQCALIKKHLGKDRYFEAKDIGIDHKEDWIRYCEKYCARNGGYDERGNLIKSVFDDGYNDLNNLQATARWVNSSKNNRKRPSKSALENAANKGKK